MPVYSCLQRYRYYFTLVIQRLAFSCALTAALHFVKEYIVNFPLNLFAEDLLKKRMKRAMIAAVYTRVDVYWRIGA